MADGQTTISRSGQPAAFAGLPADGSIKDDVSAFNLEASLEMPFGIGVKWSGERGALLPSAANSVMKGINLFNANHQTGVDGDLGTTGLKPKAALNIRRFGRLWLLVDVGIAVDTFTPGTTRGYCRFETDGGSNTQRGTWRHTDDGHVVDCTSQVLFISKVILSANGVDKIALAQVDFGIEQ